MTFVISTLTQTRRLPKKPANYLALDIRLPFTDLMEVVLWKGNMQCKVSFLRSRFYPLGSPNAL